MKGFPSYFMSEKLLAGLHPFMVISWKGSPNTVYVGSVQLGGAGGKKILRRNKCFFFFTSFPDMNLEKAGEAKKLGV